MSLKSTLRAALAVGIVSMPLFVGCDNKDNAGSVKTGGTGTSGTGTGSAAGTGGGTAGTAGGGTAGASGSGSGR